MDPRFTKFHGVGNDQLDAVISSLTDAEWDVLEQGYIDHVSQLILDDFVNPLGLADGVDGSLLFCRLYRLSLDRSDGVTP